MIARCFILMSERKNSKQMEVYEYIKSQIQLKGYPPSVREICSAVGLSSTSTVHGHLARLEKRGLIRRDATKPRAIEILEDGLYRKEMIDIPVVGTVTAGAPVLAVENIDDYFSIPLNYVKSNRDLFMLKVNGDSMIDAGILSGDLAILEVTSVALNGDIVVALIENEATIKRFFKEKDHIRLQPENQHMEPIIVEDCAILGKLIGIYREY